MTSDTRDDSPHSAPTDALQRPALRWVIVVVALLVLALVGYKAVHWFSDQDSAADADEAQTQAEGSASAPSEAATGDQPKLAPVAPAVVGRTVRPPQAKAPAARTTAQGDAINQCVVGGQVTYTNAPCPEGTAVGRADAGVVNAGAAPGLAAGGLPPGVFAGADPSQKDAECRFLTAEITRLDYEFKQPLPPPVLDQISGRLRERRERAASLNCAPAKAVDAADKKAAAPKPKPKPKPKPVVVEEKEGD